MPSAISVFALDVINGLLLIKCSVTLPLSIHSWNMKRYLGLNLQTTLFLRFSETVCLFSNPKPAQQ